MNTWVKRYYFATPLFIGVDWLWGFDIRASALDGHPALKWLYYGFCLACAGMIRQLPQWTSLVALGESAVNLIMLFVGFALPYFRMVGQFDATGTLTVPFTIRHVVNFVLAGSMALASFYSSGPGLLSTRPTLNR